MADVQVTGEEAGKVYAKTADSCGTHRLSNGDAYLHFTRGATGAQAAPDSAVTTFRINPYMDAGNTAAKETNISGTPGKESQLILPGSVSDYTIEVAQRPQGKDGRQKFGDISITDAQGNKIHTHNMTSIAFVEGKTPPPNESIKEIYDGKIAFTPVKELHSKAFAALSPMEQCTHQALTSDEFGKMIQGQKRSIGLSRETVEAIENNVTRASTQCDKGSPSR